MNEALILVGAWVAFTGSHLLLSSTGARPWLVERIGLLGYRGLFSAVAFATFIPLTVYYAGHKHIGALPWSPPPSMLIAVVMLVAFALIVASQFQPTASGMIATSTEVSGINRISRHPAFVAMIIWALAHIAANPWMTDLAFFGGFVVQLLIGPRFLDKRKLAQLGQPYQEFLDQTSYLPFAGRVTPKVVLAEFSPWVLPIAIAVTALLIHFHGQIFGP